MGDGRFELLNTPIAYPGTCYLTGSVGPVVDTGKEVEWFPANAIRPRIYLSVDVIRELSEVAGVRHVKSVGEVLHESAAYNQGYMDAVKERVGDQLVELVDRLGLLSALLGGNGGPDPAAAALDVPGAGPSGRAGDRPAGPGDGDGGPGNRPRRGQRRADLLGNPAA